MLYSANANQKVVLANLTFLHFHFERSIESNRFGNFYFLWVVRGRNRKKKKSKKKDLVSLAIPLTISFPTLFTRTRYFNKKNHPVYGRVWRGMV